MAFPLFDTHCHLGHQEFKGDIFEAVERAEKAGVRGFAIISADKISVDRVPETARDLSQKYPKSLFSFSTGIHPHDAKDLDGEVWEKIEKIAFSEAQAIGEAGLDFYYDHSDRKLQRECFQKHIDLACRTQKPLVIHCRNAAAEVLEDLKASKDLQSHKQPGILHCFTENWDFARTVLDMGFMISFSGIITFKNAAPLREVFQKVPLDRLLIETDSPWLAPVPYRGKQNEPAFVKEVGDFALSLRNENSDSVREALWKNSCKVWSRDGSRIQI